MSFTTISDGSRADLEFSFQDPVTVELFDDNATHGMAHVLKRIDFIVRFPTKTWLIEAKDPDNRLIPPHQTAKQIASFIKKMQSETLYRDELFPKLRDTLVYLSLANKCPQNHITYIAFIGMQSLDEAMLLTAQNKLQQLCYLPGPFGNQWPSQFSVLVFNIDTWNKHLAPHSVRRP